MFLRFFKGTSPGVILMIALIVIAVWLSVFLHPLNGIYNSSSESNMPLYGLLVSFLGSGHLPANIFSVSILTILLFLIVNFNTSIFFINERTFLPSLIFLLLIAVFPEYQKLNSAMPAALLTMFALKRIMAGYHKQGVAYNFFDAGILIGTGSLFYANLLWFGILIFIGIILLRAVNITEISISILGLLTPYLITFGMYYIFGYDLDSLFGLIYNNLFSRIDGYAFPRMTIVTLIIISMIVLLSIGQIIMLQNTKKIRTRKTFSLLIWMFTMTIAVYFIMPSVSVEIIWLLAIPACYFLSHYFIFSRKKLISEIFFSVIFGLALVVQCLYLFL